MSETQKTGSAAKDHQWVRPLAIRIIGHEYVADRVAAEAWCRVMAGEPPENVPLRRWIAGTIRRVVGELQNGDSASPHSLSEPSALSEPPALPSPGVEHEDDSGVPPVGAGAAGSRKQARIEAELVDHVQTLDEELARTVHHRFRDGLSLAEIADREGTEPSDVRSLLHASYAALRERLSEDKASAACLWFQRALPTKEESVERWGKDGLAGRRARVKRSPAAAVAVAFFVVFAVLATWGFLTRRDAPSGPPAVDSSVDARLPDASDIDEPAAVAPVRKERTSTENTRSAVVYEATPLPDESLAAEPVPVARDVRFVAVDRHGAPVDGLTLDVEFPAEAKLMALVMKEIERVTGRMAEHLTIETLPGGPQLSCTVRARGVGVASKPVTLFSDALPEEPVVLRVMQDYGSARVRFVESDGAPVDTRLMIPSIVASAPGERGTTDLVKGGELVIAPGDDLTLPCVGLGMEFTVTVATEFWGTQLFHCKGPVVAGERLELVHDCGAASPRFRAQLYDGEGAAITDDMQVTFIVVQGSDRRACETQVHGSGVVLAAYPSKGTPVGEGAPVPMADGGEPCVVYVRANRTKGQPPLWTAVVDALTPAAGQVVDLGRVDLRDDPAGQIKGRVVDAQGEPVGRARVFVFVPTVGEVEDAWGSHGREDFGPRLNHQGLTNVRGEFVLLRPQGYADMRVQARRARLVSPLVPAPARAGPLVLQLAPTGEVTGRVVLPKALFEGDDSAESLVAVHLIERGGKERIRHRATVQADGTFRFYAVLASLFDLEVSSLGDPLVGGAIRWPGASAALEDGVRELGDLDLRDRIRVVRLPLTRPPLAGAPQIYVDGVRVDVTVGSFLRILVPVDARRLTIACGGCRTFHCELSRLPDAIALQPELIVVVELQLPADEAEGTDAVDVELHPVGGESGTAAGPPIRSRRLAGEWADGGTIAFAVDRPGEFRLVVTPLTEPEGGAVSAEGTESDDVPAEMRVSVADVAGPQRFFLDLR